MTDRESGGELLLMIAFKTNASVTDGFLDWQEEDGKFDGNPYTEKRVTKPWNPKRQRYKHIIL